MNTNKYRPFWVNTTTCCINRNTIKDIIHCIKVILPWQWRIFRELGFELWLWKGGLTGLGRLETLCWHYWSFEIAFPENYLIITVIITCKVRRLALCFLLLSHLSHLKVGRQGACLFFCAFV